MTTKQKKTAPLKLNRDAWNDDGERVPAGEIGYFSVETAKKLIASGVGERADPLPGEE